MRFPAIDLGPNDQYIHRESNGATHVVTINKRLSDTEDRFGRRMIAFEASADGRTGLVLFGERGSVELVGLPS